MADTVTTPDGKMHVLVGSTTIESLVYDYAGPDAAAEIARQINAAKKEAEAAQDELSSYEGDLEYWSDRVHDWADILKTQLAQLQKGNRIEAYLAIKKLQEQMEAAE